MTPGNKAAQNLIAALVFALAFAPAFALAVPLGAQVRKASGSAAGDKVVVQLYVILADSGDYVPLVRTALGVRGNPDSLMLTTNDAGGVTAMLTPGAHQAITTEPVWWRGRQLTWSVPFDVHQGMGEVLLTLGNATVVVPQLAGALRNTASVSAGTVAAGGSAPRPPALAVRVPRSARSSIDIDGARWEVFEQQLGGLAPAPGGRSADSLYALVFYREGHTRQLDEFPRDWRYLSDADVADLFARARVIEP